MSQTCISLVQIQNSEKFRQKILINRSKQKIQKQWLFAKRYRITQAFSRSSTISGCWPWAAASTDFTTCNEHTHNNHPYEITTRKLCYRKDDRTMRWPIASYISRSWAVAEMAAAAILNLFESKIAPWDPPSPKTPPYNQTWSGLWIGRPVAEVMAIWDFSDMAAAAILDLFEL